MSDMENNYSSDEEIISKDHKKLLQAVTNLSKAQHIKKVARKEPTVTQTEFDLIKPRVELPREILPTKSAVSVVDLVQTLKGTGKHLNVGKELKNVQNSGKVLPKPLEKPVAERVARTINYDKAKQQLERWDAVVTQFQSAETVTFPLNAGTVYLNPGKFKKPLTRCIKSELHIAMEEAEAKLRALKGEKSDKPTEQDKQMEKMMLAKEELKKRRQELLLHKMRQSQKSAKLRLQNKIKSKKYHRLLKQHKLKEEMKEFELLQKQDPEEALRRLESLEKNRILERASLRHKNTGTWAKNNLVKAKYNRDVQKDLSEQLALSRQLTEKKDVSEDEEDAKSEEDIPMDPSNLANPWMQVNGKKQAGSAVDAIDASYRKYWLERNENGKKMEEYKAMLVEDSGVEENVKEDVKEDVEEDVKEVPKQELKPIVSKNAPVKEKKVKQPKKKQKTAKTKPKSSPVLENGWLVEDVDNEAPEDGSKTIDALFDKAEDKVLEKLASKELKRKRNMEKRTQRQEKVAKRRKEEKNALKNMQDLAFKKTAKRVEIDEPLLETAANEKPSLPTTETSTDAPKPASTATADIIKHDNIADVKPKILKTSLGDAATCTEDVDFDDEEDADLLNAQSAINDAFEDDDIMADFAKEKSAEEKKALADQLTLSMPGWGSWAGTGISEKAQQAKKKLVLQFGAKKDQEGASEKSIVRIHDVANKKLREHLVSDVPFPFKSVKDYEASIRTPIGRNFVPETAFRMLTRPAVIVRKGHIITPMDQSELVRKPQLPRTIVDKRILYDTKVAAK